MNWYYNVSKDISKLPDAIAYYESEYTIAKRECDIKGIIEKEAARLPGIVENRFSQLQEIEAILDLLNNELKRLRSIHYRRYTEHYNRQLTSRDCERFVETENDVHDMNLLVGEFALVRNKWLAISKGLDQKQWQITNITKLRVAGLDDATI